MHLIQASVQAVLPSNRKTTTGGWVSFNCPCCVHKGHKPDQRHRGGVLFSGDSFTFSCFNCGHKAGWSPGKLLSKNTKDLFRWLGIPESEISKLSFELMREKDNIPSPEKKVFSFELADVALPEDCLPVIDWIKEGSDDPDLLAIVEYILSRGLTLDDYNWHWSISNGYQDRVILPFYNDRRIVGWTGRKITAGKPKYLTHSQNGCVFNIDAQNYSRAFVIVVEGQFDAVACDGVAIMHNDPNDIQCARINALGKEVIVVPDRDKAGAVMLKAALENGWSMSLPPWEEDIKDVADAVKRYGKIYTLASILHYKISNKIIIELEKKKLERLDGL